MNHQHTAGEFAKGQLPRDSRRSRSVTLDIHGVSVRIQTDQPWVIEALDPVVCRLPRYTTNQAPPSIELDIRASTAEPLPPDHLPRCFTHGSTMCLYDGDDLWLFDHHCGIKLHADRTLAVGEVSDEALSDPVGLRQAVWMTIVELLRRTETYHVHAACVTDGKRCVLIAGDARSGKSTATVALLSAGWSYVGDDFVLLRREGPQVVALGWPDEFHVGQVAVEAFGLEAHAGKERYDGRRSLEPQEAFPSAYLERATPNTVLVTQLGGSGTSELHSIPRPSALASLIRQSPLVMVARAWADAHLAVLRDVVAQSRCYELRAGKDILSGALPRLLDEVVG